MVRLSIIVPFADDAEPFETTLVSVLQNRPADCEVLVVHGSCYDDPYDLREEVRFVEAPSGAAAQELVNSGVEAARGDVVHWLQCGIQVNDGWTEPVLGHFDDPQVGAVSPLVLSREDPRRVLAAGVAYGAGGARRVCGVGASADDPLAVPLDILGPTLLAGFYRRSVVVSVGGLDATICSHLVDVDLALSLKATGYRSVLEPSSRVFARCARDPAVSAFAAGRCAERLFWRHARSQGWLKSFVLHPLAVGAAFANDLPSRAAWTRLAGRGVACLDILMGAQGRHRLQRRANGRQAAKSKTAPGSPHDPRSATNRRIARRAAA